MRKRDILLACAAAVLLMDTAVNALALMRRVGKKREERQEERAQEAMEEADREERRRSRAMDEGIDNLMSYQPKVVGLSNVTAEGD